MIDLAEHATGTFYSVKGGGTETGHFSEISGIYHVQPVETGFCGRCPGKGGGYRLSRAPEDYKVGRNLAPDGRPLAPVSLSGGRCQALRNSAALPDPAYVDPFKQRDQ